MSSLKVYCSVSEQERSNNKAIFNHFKPVCYDSLEEMAEAMMNYGHCHAILGKEFIYRWGAWRWVTIKRLTNISYLGNLLVYDFDDGKLTFKKAIRVLRKVKAAHGLSSMVIKSKSDPKYDYDRFKMIIVTDLLFVRNFKADDVPGGFEKVKYEKYEAIHSGIAKEFGFEKHIDGSSRDIVRLIAPVTTEDRKDKRREYVIVT